MLSGGLNDPDPFLPCKIQLRTRLWRNIEALIVQMVKTVTNAPTKHGGKCAIKSETIHRSPFSGR